MKVFWIRCVYGVLALEILLYACIYMYGPSGLFVLSLLKQQRTNLQAKERAMQDEIRILRQEVQAWQSTDYFKEKYARERLLMKKEEETVYFT